MTGRTVIVVDDGLATGGTARAALRAACASAVRHGWCSPFPWARPRRSRRSRAEADEVICYWSRDLMWAVGYWYDEFGQTSDEEVAALLASADGGCPRRRAHDRSGRSPRHDEVADPGARRRACRRRSGRPRGCAAGLVLFAHGSGSSRHSPRNRQVAGALNGAGLATLLLDLLTLEEERDRANVFDIELLAERLVAATRWVRERARLVSTSGRLFRRQHRRRGGAVGRGRPADRFGRSSPAAAVPTSPPRALPPCARPVLLIVGGHDDIVIELNREALAQLRCEAELEIVPGATHLFEEPGALEAVQQRAADWFARHLARAPASTGSR